MVSRSRQTANQLDYVLDHSNRVARVCPQWSGLARERMAVSIDEEHVLGRSLWDFVSGGATCRLYDALLEHVRRSGRKVQFDYRGDGPDTIRYMRMTLLPASSGRVRFRSELLHEQSRQRVVYFTHVTYHHRPELLQCGVCQKLEYQGRWYTRAEALAYTNLIDGLLPTEVGDTVCDQCITKVELATGLRL